MNWKKFDQPTSTYDLGRRFLKGTDIRSGKPVPSRLIPGRLLRAADGQIALIGDMNELGGACDDCGFGGEWVEYCDGLIPMIEGEKK